MRVFVLIMLVNYMYAVSYVLYGTSKLFLSLTLYQFPS